MDFLVYEQDALVRTDIVETLKDAFAGVTHLIDDVRDLCSGNASQESPSVFILSVTGREVLEKVSGIMALAARGGVVIICDDPPVEAQSWGYAQFVPRPFNSGALVSAVKNALSFQQTSPIKTPQ